MENTIEHQRAIVAEHIRGENAYGKERLMKMGKAISVDAVLG